MRHRKSTKHFNRTPSHRKAMMRNMAASLFKTDGAKDHGDPGRIITTPEKAKECRRLVERLITLGKKGGVANHRRAIALLGDKAMVHTLFNYIAPRYAKRQGGYTRILHLSDVRLGDAARQCIFELVEEEIAERKPRAKKTAKKPTLKKVAPEKPAEESAPEAAVEDAPADETKEDEAGTD